MSESRAETRESTGAPRRTLSYFHGPPVAPMLLRFLLWVCVISYGLNVIRNGIEKVDEWIHPYWHTGTHRIYEDRWYAWADVAIIHAMPWLAMALAASSVAALWPIDLVRRALIVLWTILIVTNIASTLMALDPKYPVFWQTKDEYATRAAIDVVDSLQAALFPVAAIWVMRRRDVRAYYRSQNH